MIETKKVHGDPVEPSDGTRVLITRYRPRFVARGKETWHAWDRRLAPSKELFDSFGGKGGRTKLSWEEYRERFLEEMERPEAQAALGEWAKRSAGAETITLLCFCKDETHCHRSLVRTLLERLERAP